MTVATVVATIVSLPACTSSAPAAADHVEASLAEAGDEGATALGEAGADADDAALVDDRNWVKSDSGDPELTCGEIATVSVPTFGDVVSSPGGKLMVRVRVTANPRAQVPAWAWQVSRTLPAPEVPLTFVPLDAANATVSIPVEQPGTYHILVHTHYPGLAVCAADITFEAR